MSAGKLFQMAVARDDKTVQGWLTVKRLRELAWKWKRARFLTSKTYIPYHQRGSKAQDQSGSSHLSHYVAASPSFRSHRSSRPITTSSACPQSNYQPSPGGLAVPKRSSQADLASYRLTRPPFAQPGPDLNSAWKACTGSLRMASTCGDCYALWRARPWWWWGWARNLMVQMANHSVIT